MTGQTTRGLDSRDPDTALVDRLTAFLNQEAARSGADTVALLTQLISASGRPLIDEPLDVHTEVTEDRYGLATAAVNIGGVTVRVWQPTDAGDPADVRVAIATNYGYGEGYRITVTVDDHRIADAIPSRWRKD